MRLPLVCERDSRPRPHTGSLPRKKRQRRSRDLHISDFPCRSSVRSFRTTAREIKLGDRAENRLTLVRSEGRGIRRVPRPYRSNSKRHDTRGYFQKLERQAARRNPLGNGAVAIERGDWGGRISHLRPQTFQVCVCRRVRCSRATHSSTQDDLVLNVRIPEIARGDSGKSAQRTHRHAAGAHGSPVECSRGEQGGVPGQPETAGHTHYTDGRSACCD